MTLLIVFFLLSITFSFLCSIWEAVLLSITPSYITGKIHDHQPIGTTLKVFKEDIDKPLSAILTLNTIAHTVGAMGVGAQASEIFGSHGNNIGPFSMESVIAAVMTLAILILSEIIPKTLGANYWRQLASFTVVCLKGLLFILAPFVWISQLITKNMKADKSKSVFSRADFRAMTQAGEESGVLKATESSTIKNLLRLDTLKVNSIMTPRSVMFSADMSDTLREFYDSSGALRHSRIPLFDEARESIVGILLKDEALQALIEGRDEELLQSLMRPPVFVHLSDSLTKLQNVFMKEKVHMAIVIDDFGVVLGLVTMEDLFETLLGLEIMDESDDIEDLQKYARELWERRAQELGITNKSQ